MRLVTTVALTLAALAAHPADARAQAARAAASAGPTRPLAQTLTGPAKADYQVGKLLLIDGDFAGALIKLESAYATSNDPRLLWNIAACHKGERHYAKALLFLKRYVDEGGRLLTAGDRRDAQDLVALLEQLTTKMTFHVSEDGARLFIDGEPIGVSPLAAPPIIDVGERRLRVTKDGFVPFEKTIPVGGSADVAVDVTLTRDVHVGRLVVNVSPDATVLLDDKPLGHGRVDQPIAAGGHQLRVTAPAMRPFQSEIVIQDKETRSLDVVLEHDEALELPRIRVAVGCGNDEPRGADDGLVAYLDGPDVIQPVGVKRRWDADLNRNVVQYLEYGATAGPHTIRIRIPGCSSLEQRVVVDERTGADVAGAMERNDFLLFRGAQGTPGWWRVALSLWLPSEGQPVGDLAGGKLAVGAVDRWFQVDLSAAIASGSIETSISGTKTTTTTLAIQRYALRAGPRLPLNLASLGVGFSMAPTWIGLSGIQSPQLTWEFGAYSELDVQVTCDLGVFALASLGAFTDGGSIESLDFGVFLEPSRGCKDARDTAFGLRTGNGAGATGGTK